MLYLVLKDGISDPGRTTRTSGTREVGRRTTLRLAEPDLVEYPGVTVTSHSRVDPSAARDTRSSTTDVEVELDT